MRYGAGFTIPLRRATKHVACALLVATASAGPLLFAERTVHAEDPSAADVATARELFIQASAAAQKDSWEEARGLYERSLALKRAPITLYSLGVAQKHTGRWVEAIESLRAFLAEPSAAATKAYEQPARDAITELTPKLARVTITLAGSAPEGARVEVDGQRVLPAAIGAPRPMNPGAHVLTATAPDRKPARREVTLKEGERTSVELALEIAPPAPSSSVTSTASGAPTGAPTASSIAPAVTTTATTPPPDVAPSRALPLALLAGGGALLIGGIATGLIGVTHAGDAPTRDGPEAQRARTEGLIGDVLAGVGIAAAATGLVVLVVRWRTPTPAAPPTATVIASPTGITVRGRF